MPKILNTCVSFVFGEEGIVFLSAYKVLYILATGQSSAGHVYQVVLIRNLYFGLTEIAS